MTTELVDRGQATLDDLLAVGVQLEAAAERFYRGLARMFSHCPQVVEFWQRFAADEVMHGKRLAELHASMSDSELSQPVDRPMLEAGRKLLRVSPEEWLAKLHNLDEAYEMAHNLESSETNTIFRFFIAQFSHDKRLITHLMQHLDDHVERLITGLPAPYATRAQRVRVEVLRS